MSQAAELPRLNVGSQGGDDEVITSSSESRSEQSQTTTGPIEPVCEILTLSIPSMQWKAGYIRKRFDLALNGRQAQRLRQVQMGLEQQEAQLENGRYVSTQVDAIRWLLENLV